jgi:hypothetical protein
MQIVTRALGDADEGPFRRREWLNRGFLDDQLWQQAIITNLDLDSRRGPLIDRPAEEYVLWHLLRAGVVDHPRSDDRQWASATRSMWHSAAIGNRLWKLIEQERERVGGDSFMIRVVANSIWNREIVWRGSFARLVAMSLNCKTESRKVSRWIGSVTSLSTRNCPRLGVAWIDRGRISLPLANGWNVERRRSPRCLVR